ncbi:hypothetical protein [Leptolyngbya sp. 7M]|uniref:hypothetical protein n=1 Tax=Leptolyngbya sp. 7M TaxID=2812896 RepID=UPI001B8B6018|nr:hypothetical protein [Leptolyngbya sp. 7M]QYO64155.1 hypothetical protein JVX88_31105 [Leptolyngbya sp. 7M]
MRTRILITLALILCATLLTAAQSRDAARIEALLKRMVNAQVSYDRDTLHLLIIKGQPRLHQTVSMSERQALLPTVADSRLPSQLIKLFFAENHSRGRVSLAFDT